MDAMIGENGTLYPVKRLSLRFRSTQEIAEFLKLLMSHEDTRRYVETHKVIFDMPTEIDLKKVNQ